VILLDARIVGPRPHGIARYAEGLVPALRALAPDEPFVTLVAPSLPPSSPLAAGARVTTSVPPYGAREQIVLPRLIRRSGARLFHSLTYTAPRVPGMPVLLTIHDLIPLRFATRRARLKRLYYRLVIGPAARRAPVVLTVSEATADGIAALLDVPRDRIAVTPLGVDARFLTATDEDAARARERHALPRDFLLFVGNPRPHKNAAGVLRVHRRIADGHRLPIALVAVGVALAAADAAVALERGGGRAPSVLSFPRFPDEDLPGLYRAASAVVMPSLDEGFGLPALEAMACGAPVVAARRGGLPEVVGDAGLLADPDDEEAFASAIARVLASREIAVQLGALGRARAARFTWEETARRTLAAYRLALGS
jgi:glycosyltransferase involved in cell wall biosynthesis